MTACGILVRLEGAVVIFAQGNLEIPERGAATIPADESFNICDKTGPGMNNYKP